MINAINEAYSNLGMVVGHEDDVKQLLAVRVELPQSVVDVHQRLRERTWRLGLDKQAEGCVSACQHKVTKQLLLHAAEIILCNILLLVADHCNLTDSGIRSAGSCCMFDPDDS